MHLYMFFTLIRVYKFYLGRSPATTTILRPSLSVAISCPLIISNTPRPPVPLISVVGCPAVPRSLRSPFYATFRVSCSCARRSGFSLSPYHIIIILICLCPSTLQVGTSLVYFPQICHSFVCVYIYVLYYYSVLWSLVV